MAIRRRAGAGTGRRHRRRKPREAHACRRRGHAGACSRAAYFYFHRAPKLTDKDTIVLADFVNNTGDPIFDGTLRQGLAIQLEQSPFLKIMDDEQVQRVLRLMSLPPGARITNQIAHEICVREGAAATIDGTIASLGKSYVITLQAIACQDGATLAREQIQADDKEHVLNAVGTAATAMRGKLGESHNSIQKLNRPLEQATTPSLEALQNYTAGFSEMSQGHFLAAVPLFERAIAIDPNFAMAYYFLGVAFDQAGDMARSRGICETGFPFDRPGFRVRAGPDHCAYYYRATGELDKAIDAYQLGIRNYPRYWGFHNNLSIIYIDLGQYEEGLKEGLEAARLQPNVEPPYRRQLDAYICLDRLPEARQLAEKLRAQGLDGARIHQRFLEMAYIEDDQAAIAREIQWFAGKPEEYLSLGLQAANRNVHGQRRESHKLFQRAAETALRRGLRNAASEFEEADARADALVGQLPDRAPPGASGPGAGDVRRCGPGGEARRGDFEAFSKRNHLECRAATRDSRGDRAQSRSTGRRAWNCWHPPRHTSALTSMRFICAAWLTCVCIRARRQRLSSGKSWITRAPIGALPGVHPYWGQFYSLSYLGMARGSALAGDTAKAKKAFQDFFELWKDADPGHPDSSASQSGIRQAAVNENGGSRASTPLRRLVAFPQICARSARISATTELAIGQVAVYRPC